MGAENTAASLSGHVLVSEPELCEASGGCCLSLVCVNFQE